jgi:hypothetical protein
MSDPLPSDVAAGSTLRGEEYGWTLSAFPAALTAAERLGLACLGGQFQFRLDDAVYEPFWTSADSSERHDGEDWSSYVHRSCGEVAVAFQRVLSTTDFQELGRAWPDVSARVDGGLDIKRTLVFVAYFVTEPELNSLSQRTTSHRVDKHRFR